MSNLLDTLLTVLVGSFNGVSRTLTSTAAALEDFFYVKFRGLPFIVLGSRQTGKTTLIEWLRHNMNTLDEFDPDPTAAGGEVVDDFAAKLDNDRFLKLKPTRDVGGEYSMWETDWIELFRTAQPRGIIFMIDHTEPYIHKDALNFVLQMIDDEPSASLNVKAIYVIINKADLWRGTTSEEEIWQFYRNEHKRMKAQSERVGYKFAVVSGSLATGEGMRVAMQDFFNLLRPRPKT